jgi:flagellar biosynthesis/type III secretory pathway M-ring protein FliF/YscJ
MNNPDNLEERFRQLEKEVYASTQQQSNDPTKRAEPDQQRSDDPTVANSSFDSSINTAKSWAADLVTWINGLTGVTKIVAIAVVGVVAFGIMSFVFRLVTAAISLAIMALVVYILYKVFLEPEPKS